MSSMTVCVLWKCGRSAIGRTFTIVFDLQGGGTISTGVLTRSTIDLAELQTGVVLFRLHTEHGLVLKRFLAE